MAEGSAGTALWVALAGGTGGLLGALIGQAIQWFREERAERRVDERRQQDALRASVHERQLLRREAYLAALRFLHDLERALSTAQFIADIARGTADEHVLAGAKDLRRKVGRTVTDDMGEVVALISAVGSDAVCADFRELESITVQFALEPATSRLAPDALEGHVPGTPVAELRRVSMSAQEQAQSMHESIGSVVHHVTEMRSRLRAELDLD